MLDIICLMSCFFAKGINHMKLDEELVLFIVVFLASVPDNWLTL